MRRNYPPDFFLPSARGGSPRNDSISVAYGKEKKCGAAEPRKFGSIPERLDPAPPRRGVGASGKRRELLPAAGLDFSKDARPGIPGRVFSSSAATPQLPPPLHPCINIFVRRRRFYALCNIFYQSGTRQYLVDSGSRRGFRSFPASANGFASWSATGQRRLVFSGRCNIFSFNMHNSSGYFPEKGDK